MLQPLQGQLRLGQFTPGDEKDDLELWRQVMADCNLSNQSESQSESPSGQNDTSVHLKILYVALLHDVD